MQLLAEARKVLLVKHQQWDAVYWKRNVVVDRALSPPGLVLHKFTKLLDCCSYMQAAKRVLSGSFNSERFLGSIVDKPSEPFFESLVSWWNCIVLYCIVLYCIVLYCREKVGRAKVIVLPHSGHWTASASTKSKYGGQEGHTFFFQL